MNQTGDGRSLFGRLLGFGLVGGLATLIYAVLVIMLAELLAVSATLAAVLAFILATLVSYLGHSRWVFVDRIEGQDPYGRLGRFYGVTLVSFGFNVGGMYLINEVAGWYYGWGVAFSCLVVPLVTFWLHNRWTFGERNHGV
jgi:putative flippase GtrA